MQHTTKGILLKTIKYGDTSVIASIFTDGFGLQTYMIKGVRSGKKSRHSSGFLQAGMILDLVVYHNPGKNFQTISEMNVDEHVPYFYDDIAKNCIALFAVELLLNFIVQDDTQPELFEYCYHYFENLAKAETHCISHFPLLFTIAIARISGYSISGMYNTQNIYLDIHQGIFTDKIPTFPPIIDGQEAATISKVCNTPLLQLPTLNLTAAQRSSSLTLFLLFLELHVPNFRKLKSLSILTTILH